MGLARVTLVPGLKDESSERHRVRFGAFVLDPGEGTLFRDGVRLKLSGIPLEILDALTRRPGALISRADLRERIWADGTHVDFDANLNSAVNRLRETLGDAADRPRFIETVPRKGYRFVAEVEPEVRDGADRDRGFTPWIRGLAGLALAGLALAGLALGAAWVGLRVEPPRPDGRLTLAVLPFRNVGAADQEYFSDGLTEELTARLGRLRPLRLGVVGSTSARRFRDDGRPLDVIGEELGVQYLLSGTVRHAGDRVRITAQLVSAHDQLQIWSDAFDRARSDVFGVQSEVAESVAAALAVELMPTDPAEIEAVPDGAAYDAYLKGRYLLNKQAPEPVQASIASFELAAKLAPEYPAPHVGLAEAFAYLAGHGSGAAVELYPKAIASAEKAIALDAEMAEAHAVLGHVRLTYERAWEEAQRELDLAIRLDPGSPRAHLYRGCYMTAVGRHDEALRAAETARALDPLSFYVHVEAGWYQFMARRYDEAVRLCQRTIELEPAHPTAGICVVLARLMQGQDAEAYAAERSLLVELGAGEDVLTVLDDLKPRDAVLQAWRWHVQGMSSMVERGQHVSAYTFAMHYAVLGGIDEALDALERAEKERDGMLVYAGVDPVLDDLRERPRFRALVERLGIPAPPG